MEYIAQVTKTRPLTIWFSFLNRPDSQIPVIVPLQLYPLGAFVRIEIANSRAEMIYQTPKPKIHLKRDPARAESYFALEPGHSYGATFEVEGLELEPGNYQLHIGYTNEPFFGTNDYPLGKLTYEVRLPLRVPL